MKLLWKPCRKPCRKLKKFSAAAEPEEVGGGRRRPDASRRRRRLTREKLVLLEECQQFFLLLIPHLRRMLPDLAEPLSGNKKDLSGVYSLEQLGRSLVDESDHGW